MTAGSRRATALHSQRAATGCGGDCDGRPSNVAAAARPQSARQRKGMPDMTYDDRERNLRDDPMNVDDTPVTTTDEDKHAEGGEALGAGAGALGGALVGGAVAGPPGAVVGVLVGAAGGALAGEKAEGGNDDAGSMAGGAGGAVAGAVIGGAVAGPPGAIVGGAVGAG